jgi:hypothetical protein
MSTNLSNGIGHAYLIGLQSIKTRSAYVRGMEQGEEEENREALNDLPFSAVS